MTTADDPRRRAVARSRPWVREVPAAFEVPDVPGAAVAVPATPGAATATAGTRGEMVAGRSRDGSAEVEVDLRGHLCHLRIDPHVLRGAHPRRVGPAVVEAMADARGRVIRLSRERRGR